MAKHNRKAKATPTTTEQVAPTTPAPLATTPTTVVAPAAPSTTPAATQASNPILAKRYKAGKPYNVRPNSSRDNAATWDLITKALAANEGVATRAQLQEAVKERNHVDMVGYAIRRGWLAEA